MNIKQNIFHLSLFIVIFSMTTVILPLDALAKNSKQADISLSNSPQVPQTAWVIEGTGAVLMGLGFISITAGYSFIGRRDQLVQEAERGQNSLATEVRENEDIGTTLLTVGWVVGGIGVTGMLIGAIWLVTYSPPKENNNPTTLSIKPLQHLTNYNVSILFDNR